MEKNEENTTQYQELFLKYFIQSIQKQQHQQNGPIDFSLKYCQPSAVLTENKHQSLNLVENRLNEFYKNLYNFTEENQPINSSPETKSLSPKTKNQDEGYWERRKKNNEAAKRSRDARRAKEDQMALRAVWLEQENVKLRLENAHLKQENIQLRCKIYNSIES